MKKRLLAAILMGVSAVSAAEELTFGTEPSYPPFEATTEKGELVGFDIDVARAICKHLSFQNPTFRCVNSKLKSQTF